MWSYVRSLGPCNDVVYLGFLKRVTPNSYVGEAHTWSYPEGLEKILQFIRQGVRVVKGVFVIWQQALSVTAAVHLIAFARGNPDRVHLTYPHQGTLTYGTARVFGCNDWWFFSFPSSIFFHVKLQMQKAHTGFLCSEKVNPESRSFKPELSCLHSFCNAVAALR